MPHPDDRSNGRSSPYNSRRYDPRGSVSMSRNSRDERGSEERRSDERPSYPSQNNATARMVPSGPRGSSSMPRPPQSNQERTLGTKTSINNSMERGSEQNSPITKHNMEPALLDAAPAKSPNGDAYKEVLACLADFTQQVTENTSLSFQRDKARRTYHQKQENYEKTQGHHTNYLAISEQQKKSRETARLLLEGIEQKAKAKQQEMARTMESLASRIISGGVDTGAINKNLQRIQDQVNELEKRFKAESNESLASRNSLAALGRDVHQSSESFSRELSSIKNEISSVKAATAKNQASTMQLEYERNAVSNLGARFDDEVAKIRQEMLNTKQQDIGPLRQQVGSIDREVKLVKEENKATDQEIKRNYIKWEQDHKLLLSHETFLKTFDSESIKNEVLELRQKITALEDKTAKLQKQDQKRLTEELGGLRRRIEVLESRPARAQSVTSSAPRSGSATATASDGYAIKMEELFSAVDLLRGDFHQLETNMGNKFVKFQEDNDDIYGNSLDELNKQVMQLIPKVAKVESLMSDMETVVRRTTSLEDSFEGLKNKHNDNVQGLASSQSQQGGIILQLQKDVQALKVTPRPVEVSSNYPQNPNTGYVRQISSPVVSNVPAPGRQSGSPVVNSSDLVQTNFKSLSDRCDALTMSISHLNTRFNSLTTDALARQMWSQLDNVHPHLKDATKGIEKMTHTIQMIEGQLPTFNQRITSLERNPALPEGLKDALEKFDVHLTSLGTRADEADKTDQGLQKQIDIIVKNQTTVTPYQSNGTSRLDGSSSDSGLVKRKAPDATNGNSKRTKVSSNRRIINDTDDEESQGNGHSDALSPTSK